MLAYEVGLTRLFSVQQFHHFAFMVVSLAVLGISASGLVLSLQPEHPPLSIVSAAFAVSVGLSYLVINQLPFDSYAIAWNQDQVWILLLYFTAAGLPFLFAGWAAGGSMAAAGEQAHLPYGAVFVGSGLGAPAALAAHSWGGASGAITVSAILGLGASLLFARNRGQRVAASGAVLVLSAVFMLRPAWVQPTLSPYKALEQARRSVGAQLAGTQWDAVSRLDAVHGAGTHRFPGLSLRTGAQLPEQLGLYLDGSGPLPVTRLDPDSAAATDLASRFPTHLAYQLRPQRETLIVEPGGGLEALIALGSGAETVIVPSDNALLIEALKVPYRSESGDLFARDSVHVETRASRGVLAEPDAMFGIVVLALSDPFRPVTSGAFSLQENYVLTVDAFQAGYRALGSDGLLVITRWLGTPPSESARAWATLLEALERDNAADVSDRLIAYRSMRTMTMVAARRPFNPQELQRTRRFLNRNGFDPVHLPDLDRSEVNQRNRLPEPVYYELFQDLLRDRRATLASYDFELEPAKDGRPYFFHFFRWRQTPDVLQRLGRTMQPFGGSGYFVLLALLGLTILLALPLVVVPAALLVSKGRSRPDWNASLYFGGLGAGYLLVEVPLISWFGLLLDHPATALATVLFTIMLASGIGSWLSPRLSLRHTLTALVILILLTTAALPWVVKVALPWPLPGRLAVAVAVLLPVGTLMGVPFAAGLRRLEQLRPGLIPWAWGVNGAISGVSGVLGALIAIDLSFSAVLIVAAASYTLARLTVPRAFPT